MRYFLILFFLFVIVKSYGQDIELKGRFGASFIGGETIEFIGKDSFYFYGFYCSSGVHGKGRSEIRNNYLYLFFEKNKGKAKIDSLRPAIIRKSPNVDSVSEIQITIVDNNEVPIPYATVQLKRGEEVEIGTVADISGRAVFRIKNNSLPIIVKTSAVGIEPGYLELGTGSNYDIKLFHRPNDLFDKELNNGEVYVYEIGELSEDYILMRPQKSSEQFRKYTKKSE